MSIKTLTLKNFTVFKDIKIDVSENVNIFVGENGTGKTHLLKAIYAACEISKNKNIDIFKQCFKSYGLVGLSKNDDNKIVDISLKSDLVDKEVIASSLNFNTLRIITNDSINKSTKKSSAQPEKNNSVSDSYEIHIPQNESFSAIFIPSKDMLTHSKGLLAMSDKYREFPFDKTLLNIINKANQWTLKQPPVLATSILPVLEEMINGTIVIENEEFFVMKKEGYKVNFAIEAEGLKKIGLLWQLLMNESIVQNSILIWDEPEANLNPKFLPKLVDCLLTLSRNGVQIFLSTHNYIFAKYFDVLKNDKDKVLFHSLYLKNKIVGVKCESKPFFAELQHNDIANAFNQLLERVYKIKTGN